MQCIDLRIIEDRRRIIEKYVSHREYYQACLQEFGGMKESKFYNNVSVFSILVDSQNKLSSYGYGASGSFRGRELR